MLVAIVISFLAGGITVGLPLHVAYRGIIRLLKLDSISALNNQAFESYVAGFKKGKEYASSTVRKKSRVDDDTEVISISA